MESMKFCKTLLCNMGKKSMICLAHNLPLNTTQHNATEKGQLLPLSVVAVSNSETWLAN